MKILGPHNYNTTLIYIKIPCSVYMSIKYTNIHIKIVK